MQMQTPHGSPDSLRQFLQLSKKFYQLHTPKDFGYEDCDGLQYVGSVHNFGAEILLESRKLRMRKPPIPIIRPSEYFSYYFDIAYADFINTYRQPNMLMGCVKSDTMLSNHTYQLVFNDCEECNANRAEAYSDQNVHVSKFYKTTTNPILMIDDEPHPIFCNIDDVTWYFAVNDATNDMYTIEQDPLHSWKYTVTTIDMKSHVGWPFVWLCVSEMNMYPPIEWPLLDPLINNIDMRNRPLLEYGTDGNDITHLYPLTYGYPAPSGTSPLDENYPNQKYVDQLVGKDRDRFWYLKAFGYFLPNKPTGEPDERNFDVKITKIQYIHCDTESYTDGPNIIHSIVYESDFAKISLADGQPWIFRTPQEGDYDYDGVTYNNPMVACIPLQHFATNTTTEENPNPILIPAFDIQFSDGYYHKFETEINQMRAGIHLDQSPMSMKHTVDKHDSVVYNLTDFYGIPFYYASDGIYRSQMGYDTPRAHMELYAIRDDANEKNKNTYAEDLQTAAILLDVGVPVNKLYDIPSSAKAVVYYNLTKDHTYSTNKSNITSDMNMLTTIGYVNDNMFADKGDKSNPRYENAKPFVYHGNGRFSLGWNHMTSSNYGRCYLLSNDPMTYENNATSRNAKAPRTAARICDIPTSFTQLQNISGTSPTLVIDKNYVRQKASYNVNQCTRLWNGFVSHWVKGPSSLTNNWIFHDDTNLSTLRTFCQDKQWLTQHFGEINGGNDYIVDKININSMTISILNPGEDYVPGDEVGFNIGGRFLRFEIATVNNGGIASYQNLSINDSIPDQTGTLISLSIPLANFDDIVTTYQLSTLSGTGHDGSIKIIIDEVAWNRYKSRQLFDQEDIDKNQWYYELTYVTSGQTEPPGWNQWYYNTYTQSGEYPNYIYTQVPESDPPPTWEPYTYYTKERVQKRTILPRPSGGGLYAFLRYPNINGINVIGYDNELEDWDLSTMTQISGELERGDPYYDDTSTKEQRTLLNTFLYNNLINQNFEQDDILSGIKNGSKTISVHAKEMSYEPDEGITREALMNGDDLHQLVNDTGMNAWNAYIGIVPSTTDNTKFYTITWLFDMNASHIVDGNNQNLLFPARSDGIHVNDYDNSWSSIKFNKRNGMLIPFMYDILHKTFDTYVEHGGTLKLTNQSDMRLSELLPMNTAQYPSDAQMLHSGSAANFNIYQFKHLYLDELNTLRDDLYQYNGDQLYQMAIEMFGDQPSILTEFYSYETTEYASNTLYTVDKLLTQHLTTVDYEMQHVYAIDTMLIDTTSNEMYRALKPFVSANVDNDLRRSLMRDVYLGNLEYVSMKPVYPDDKLYRTIRAFTSTTIDEDLENGNIVYVGLSSKVSDIINYMMENDPYLNPLKYSGEDTLYVEKDHLMNTTPTGGFIPLMDTVEDMNTVNGVHVTVNPLYVFRLENFSVSLLDNYRVYDGDVDISEQSMLIINVGGQYRQYVFNNNKWEWNYHS